MTGHKGERKQNHQSSSALGTGGNRKKSLANTTCMSPNGTHRSRATRAMKSNRLKTSCEALTIDTSSTVRSTNNTLVFLIRVGSLASSFASTWRAMSVADPWASPVAMVKRCGKSFPIIIGSYAPCIAQRPHDHRLTERLHAGGPPWKKYIVAGQNKRDDCFLLFHDDTRQSPSRSMRRSRWTCTHRASAAAPRPKGAANEPTWWRKETYEAKIKLRTRTVTASTSTSSLVHQQKLAAVSLNLKLKKGLTTRLQFQASDRLDGAEPSIFRDYKLDDNDARDDVWDQEVFNSIWRRGSVDRGSAFPNLLFFLVCAYLVEWENFENRPRPKFFSARACLYAQGSPRRPWPEASPDPCHMEMYRSR